MIAIYRFFKVVYDQSQENAISSISLVGNEFVLPNQCTICNSSDVKMTSISLSIKDVKMNCKYNFQLPYCKTHRRMMNIYYIIGGLFILIFMLPVIFMLPYGFSLNSLIIAVGLAFIPLGIPLGFIYFKLVQPYFLYGVNNGFGIWGVELHKASESLSKHEPFMKVGFNFHNESFGRTLKAENTLVLNDFSKDQLKANGEELPEDRIESLIRERRKAVEEKNKALFDRSTHQDLDS